MVLEDEYVLGRFKQASELWRAGGGAGGPTGSYSTRMHSTD